MILHLLRLSFKNAQGDYVGIDVDLVKRAAGLQGFTVEFKFIGF